MNAYPFKVNLFIVGARKAGTSALKTLLAQHPQISMSDIKEPGHFVTPNDTNWELYKNKTKWADAEAYHALFEYHESADYYGEATTLYGMRHIAPGVAERIHAYNPNARFIYMVREPTACLVSHYLQDYRIARTTLPLSEALSPNSHYIKSCDYTYQISPYLEQFPQQNVHFIVSERLKVNAGPVMRDLCGWLGIENIDLQDTGSDQDRNVTPARVGRPRKIYTALRGRGQHNTLWRAISKALPASLKETVRPLLYSGRLTADDIISHDEVTRLIGSETERIKRETRELLDDTLPEWD